MKMKKWFIKNLGLKGSWKWAKKQMMNGKMVRCKHWSGALKLRIDSPENTLLQACFGVKIKSLKMAQNYGKPQTIFCLTKSLQTMRFSSGSLAGNVFRYE